MIEFSGKSAHNLAEEDVATVRKLHQSRKPPTYYTILCSKDDLMMAIM